MSKKQDRSVSQKKDGTWVNKSNTPKKTTSVHPTQEDAINQARLNLQHIITEARQLPQKERIQLMHELVDMIDEKPTDESEYSQKSLLDFRGVGAHAYDGTDAQEYVNQLRDEWDNS